MNKKIDILEEMAEAIDYIRDCSLEDLRKPSVELNKIINSYNFARERAIKLKMDVSEFPEKISQNIGNLMEVKSWNVSTIPLHNY